jgi:PDZ domain-containing protein
MTRRSTALTLAAVCLVALFGVAFLAPVPYVVMSPGITENTLGSYQQNAIITIAGHRTYPTTGHLNMTTVSVTSPDYSVRLPQVLAAWFSSDEIVLPRDVVYPPNQSVSQVDQQNTEEMLDSQSSAVVAGLWQLGIRANFVRIQQVLPGTPASGVLQVGDEVTSVDGSQVIDADQLGTRVSAFAPGTTLRLGVIRDGKPTTVSLRTQADPDSTSSSRIGVRLLDDYKPPFKVSINLGQDIGGPSAGMMFSLAIYDKLTPGPLAGGRFIAGTGTIDATGTVGIIGGIQQKIIGAYDAGARYFLTPAGNCAEAEGAPVASKIELLKVSTLAGALSQLKALDTGDTSALVRCGS